MRVVKVERLLEYTEEQLTVSGWSTIRVKHNSYSVPSRLIGEAIKVRVYESYLEVWHGGERQMTTERLLGRNKHRIDYPRELLLQLCVACRQFLHKPRANTR